MLSIDSSLALPWLMQTRIDGHPAHTADAVFVAVEAHDEFHLDLQTTIETTSVILLYIQAALHGHSQCRLPGGRRSPKLAANLSQFKAKKSGRRAGVGNSRVRASCTFTLICSSRFGLYRTISSAHGQRLANPFPAKYYTPLYSDI